MKEYLKKDYKLVLRGDDIDSSDIEVPEGAEIATISKKNGLSFWKDEGVSWWNLDDHKWEKWGTLQDHIKNSGHEIVWQRSETECLMQGKNGERLMESVGQLKASKEKHSHYKKSVKHLDFIDPYRIAQLYDLHSCADHIAKKALCTGKRGHKDLIRDIQDIIDTAERWKQMIQEDQNAI